MPTGPAVGGPVAPEVVHEAAVRLGAAADVLARLEAAERGAGPYTRVPAWLLAQVPRCAIEIARPALARLERETAPAAGVVGHG